MPRPPEEDTQGIGRPKNLAFHTLTILLSFLLALLIIELILRNVSYTSNIALQNSASQRWMEKHWRSNEQGYRDLLIAPRLSSTKPKIYFVGDSFTAGAGVDFRDTYYFKTGFQLESHYNFFNIARPGLSTRGEHSELQHFNNSISSRPDIVVHQYFINDIDDYIAKPAWEIPGWLELLSGHLESAQLLGIYLFNQEWSNAYRDSLLSAHRSTELLERHENDVKLLHQGIRDNGGTVIFLVFPSLRDRDTGATSFVIDNARRFFSRTCQPADMYIDATPAALSLKEPERVVSFLDQHPSPALHSLIANQVIKAIVRESAEGGSYKAYETCKDLKAAQARRAETQP